MGILIFRKMKFQSLPMKLVRIKGQRNIKTGHKTDNETEQIQEYLNQKMFQMEVKRN